MPGLSQRGYARHRKELGLRGGSLRAVQIAIERERIPVLPDGKIDPVAADLAWSANTTAPDPAARAKNGRGHQLTGAGRDFAAARARKERALAAKHELELVLRQRNVLPIDFVVRELGGILAELNAFLEQLDQRLPPRLVSVQTEQAIRQIIRAEIERGKAELLAGVHRVTNGGGDGPP
jgi:hypothetical protein